MGGGGNQWNSLNLQQSLEEEGENKRVSARKQKLKLDCLLHLLGLDSLFSKDALWAQ